MSDTKIIKASQLRPGDMIKVDTESPRFSEVICTVEDPDRFGYGMVQVEVTRHHFNMFMTLPPNMPVEVMEC